MSLKAPIIVDLGSYEIKTGFKSVISEPSTIFPSYIGEPKYDKILRSININKPNKKDQFIGDSCSKYLGLLKLRYPIQNGIFTNERDISLIFNHIFSKLGLNSEEIQEHPILITEPILNPNDNREKISQILFEKYGVPALIFGSQPQLSLFSFSFTSGIVLESGHEVSQICAVMDGYSIPSSFMRSNFGGKDVSDYFGRILKLNGFEFVSDTEKLILNRIKQKYIMCQIIGEEKSNKKYQYKLPDSRIVEFDLKDYNASQVMFDPTLVGKKCLGFDKMVETCIEKVNFNLRENLCDNIKLTGGNCLMRNFNQVMHTILHTSLNRYKRVNVKAYPNNCIISNWNGGNIISGLGIFKDLLVYKKDWDEKGKDIVNKQAF